jgi:putative ATP-grasp target RiPP
MSSRTDAVPTGLALRPWALGRMRPYPPVKPEPWASVELDPATQLAVYRDQHGQLIEMGRHGTSRGTETRPQSTNVDSRNDTDNDQDNERD